MTEFDLFEDPIVWINYPLFIQRHAIIVRQQKKSPPPPPPPQKKKKKKKSWDINFQGHSGSSWLKWFIQLEA